MNSPSTTTAAMTKIAGANIASHLSPAGQRAGADSGDPQLRTFVADHQAQGNIGFWECQPGGWPVIDRTDTEVAYILSGTGTITDDATGTTYDIGVGDLVILPVGWSGRWDIGETVTKVYVIY